MKLPAKTEIIRQYILTEIGGEQADAFINVYYLPLKDKFAKKAGELIEQGYLVKDVYASIIGPIAGKTDMVYYQKLNEPYRLGEVSIIETKKYEENPYAKLLGNLKKAKMGPYVLQMESLPAYRPFVFSTKTVLDDKNYRDISPLAAFSTPFRFPSLRLRNRIWMSLVPHEIETMESAIEEASGNVLTYGLGLGYFAFMASQKENVDKVTVIEKDPKVIALFQKHLLPLFPHKEKIFVCQADALEFAAAKPSGFTYCFADLWHNPEDGLPLYLKLKKMEFCPTSYWIEKDILVYFRRHLIALIDEESKGAKDKDYLHPKNFSEQLLGALHAHLSKKTIDGERDLHGLLSEESLKRIAATIRIQENI